MQMTDTIYLVDEYTGKIIPVEAGRYRVVRNNDAMIRDIPMSLVPEISTSFAPMILF